MPNKTTHIDQFLLIHSARADNWREITTLADAWAANRGERAALEAAIAEAGTRRRSTTPIRVGDCFRRWRERIATNDAGGAAKLARRISNGLLSHCLSRAPERSGMSMTRCRVTEVADIMPPATGEAGGRRPYFEVLFVNSQPAARWDAFAAEIPQTAPARGWLSSTSLYLVGSFEDALLRGRIEPRHHFCRARRRLSLSLAARRAGASLGAGSAWRSREPRHVGAAPCARVEADPAGTRRLSALRPPGRKDCRRSGGRCACGASSTRLKSRSKCTSPSLKACRRATKRRSSTI